MIADTTQLRGLALLDAAIAHIEANPQTWEQDDFRCGSGMCVGGWICELAGGAWLTPQANGILSWYLEAEPTDPPGTVRDVMLDGKRVPAVMAYDRARRLIGAPAAFVDLDDDEDRRRLFDGGNDLGDIKAIRDEIAAWFESQAIS